MSSADLLPDRASGERSPVEKIKKETVTHLGAPGVVEPHSGSVVVVSHMPMVSPERSDVRGGLVLRSCEGWGWGRIATRARNVPSGLG